MRRHYAETRVGRKGRGRQQLSCLVSLELGLWFCSLLCTYLFLVWPVVRSSVKTDGSFADELILYLSGKCFLCLRVPDLSS